MCVTWVDLHNSFSHLYFYIVFFFFLLPLFFKWIVCNYGVHVGVISRSWRPWLHTLVSLFFFSLYPHRHLSIVSFSLVRFLHYCRMCLRYSPSCHSTPDDFPSFTFWLEKKKKTIICFVSCLMFASFSFIILFFFINKLFFFIFPFHFYNSTLGLVYFVCVWCAMIPLLCFFFKSINSALEWVWKVCLWIFSFPKRCALAHLLTRNIMRFSYIHEKESRLF